MVTTLRCSDCQAIFTRIADLEEHQQIAHQQHPEGIGEISGHMGALGGQTAHDLSGGMAGRTGPWRCIACGSEFPTRSEWEDHLRLAHTT